MSTILSQAINVSCINMTKLLFDNESICGLETCLEKLNNFQEETNAKIGKLETYSANLEMEKDFQTPKYDLVCK